MSATTSRHSVNTMAKTSDADMRSAMKYQKAHIRRVVLNLNDRTDADIIEYLEKHPNKAKTLKMIIREAMKEESR